MFAGDKSKPAANASYKNLSWKDFHDDSFKIGTKIREDKEIGTIDSWGPFFRISFDLIIHSHDKNVEWTSVLAFIKKGASCVDCNIEDRVILIGLHNNGYVQISNTFENVQEYFYFDVKLNHWYTIIIEQNSVNRKVMKLKIKPAVASTMTRFSYLILRDIILLQLMEN